MSRITKKEWDIINGALAYFATDVFENEVTFDCTFPDLSIENDKDLDKAEQIYENLRRKVWDKI